MEDYDFNFLVGIVVEVNFDGKYDYLLVFIVYFLYIIIIVKFLFKKNLLC